jgi:hypothetical protein
MAFTFILFGFVFGFAFCHWMNHWAIEAEKDYSRALSPLPVAVANH